MTRKNRNRNKMMTTTAVAVMLNVHVNTVRRWSDMGLLSGYRVGPRGDRRFAREEINQLLVSREFGHSNEHAQSYAAR